MPTANGATNDKPNLPQRAPRLPVASGRSSRVAAQSSRRCARQARRARRQGVTLSPWPVTMPTEASARSTARADGACTCRPTRRRLARSRSTCGSTSAEGKGSRGCCRGARGNPSRPCLHRDRRRCVARPRWTSRLSDGPVNAIVGDVLPDNGHDVKFLARAAIPAGASLVLLRDGVVVTESGSSTVESPKYPAAGTYRVEARVAGGFSGNAADSLAREQPDLQVRGSRAATRLPRLQARRWSRAISAEQSLFEEGGGGRPRRSPCPMPA